MNKSGIYIFDLDGTLVDSMAYFSKGILSIADDAGLSYGDELLKKLTALGIKGGAEYYVNELGVKGDPKEIAAKLVDNLVCEYSNHVDVKPGVKDYLLKIKSEGARLFVLTANAPAVTEAALKRNGIYELFETVWSVEDFCTTKSDVGLFYKVAEALGCECSDINYFDDSLIALDNAGKAGYVTYGVYDAQSDAEIEKMKREYSFYVDDFQKLI